MNFREWLRISEDSNKPPNQGVRAGQPLGGPRTMLPISWGMDNRAVGSILGGIGDARAKIRAQMGAEPGSVPHISNLEDIRKSALQSIYMPLQLPKDGSGSQSLSRALVARARGISANPLEDERIYRVEESGEGVQVRIRDADLKKDPNNMNTRLYRFHKNDEDGDERLQAINFTTALMQVSLSSANMFGNYSHLLNLDHVRPKDQKWFPVPFKPEEYRTRESEDETEHGPDYNPEFYMILLCTFEINPKDKNSHISGDVWDEIEAMRDAERNKKTAATSPDAETKKPETTPATT